MVLELSSHHIKKANISQQSLQHHGSPYQQELRTHALLPVPHQGLLHAYCIGMVLEHTNLIFRSLQKQTRKMYKHGRGGKFEAETRDLYGMKRAFDLLTLSTLLNLWNTSFFFLMTQKGTTYWEAS